MEDFILTLLQYFFDLTSLYRQGQKYENIFSIFLVQMKTLKSSFDINWPLVAKVSVQFSVQYTTESEIWIIDRFAKRLHLLFGFITFVNWLKSIYMHKSKLSLQVTHVSYKT